MFFEVGFDLVAPVEDVAAAGPDAVQLLLRAQRRSVSGLQRNNSQASSVLRYLEVLVIGVLFYALA